MQANIGLIGSDYRVEPPQRLILPWFAVMCCFALDSNARALQGRIRCGAKVFTYNQPQTGLDKHEQLFSTNTLQADINCYLEQTSHLLHCLMFVLF